MEASGVGASEDLDFLSPYPEPKTLLSLDIQKVCWIKKGERKLKTKTKTEKQEGGREISFLLPLQGSHNECVFGTTLVAAIRPRIIYLVGKNQQRNCWNNFRFQTLPACFIVSFSAFSWNIKQFYLVYFVFLANTGNIDIIGKTEGHRASWYRMGECKPSHQSFAVLNLPFTGVQSSAHHVLDLRWRPHFSWEFVTWRMKPRFCL